MAAGGISAMKVTCQACDASFLAPDEKIRGRVVKYHCRKCGSIIVADGTALDAWGDTTDVVPPPAASSASPRDSMAGWDAVPVDELPRIVPVPVSSAAPTLPRAAKAPSASLSIDVELAEGSGNTEPQLDDAKPTERVSSPEASADDLDWGANEPTTRLPSTPPAGGATPGAGFLRSVIRPAASSASASPAAPATTPATPPATTPAAPATGSATPAPAAAARIARPGARPATATHAAPSAEPAQAPTPTPGAASAAAGGAAAPKPGGAFAFSLLGNASSGKQTGAAAPAATPTSPSPEPSPPPPAARRLQPPGGASREPLPDSNDGQALSPPAAAAPAGAEREAPALGGSAWDEVAMPSTDVNVDLNDDDDDAAPPSGLADMRMLAGFQAAPDSAPRSGTARVDFDDLLSLSAPAAPSPALSRGLVDWGAGLSAPAPLWESPKPAPAASEGAARPAKPEKPEKPRPSTDTPEQRKAREAATVASESVAAAAAAIAAEASTEPLFAPLAPASPVSSARPAAGAPAAVPAQAAARPNEGPTTGGRRGLMLGVGAVVLTLAFIGIRSLGSDAPPSAPSSAAVRAPVPNETVAAAPPTEPTRSGTTEPTAAAEPTATSTATAPAAPTEAPGAPTQVAAVAQGNRPPRASEGDGDAHKGGQPATPREAPPSPPTHPTAASTPAAPATTTAAPTAAPPAAAGGEFNRDAARGALNSAAGAALGCGKPDGPKGVARVSITFAPSGRVTQALVNGPPFAGTPVGGCIAATFRRATVPAFSGAPVSVTKTVQIQ
jgi:hypothetical protein